MKYVLVFDLDDTLYAEETYVLSGFRAVANYMETEWGIASLQSYRRMVMELKARGRGVVFDNVLIHFNQYSQQAVKKCVSVYRLHQPEIELDYAALTCLKRFQHLPIYIVTDGNKIVQTIKIKALGVKKFVKRCFVTHQYGINNAKPSPFCFLRIAHLEKVEPTQVVYIADNPNKDFIGIKPLGFRTIRILKGHWEDQMLDPDHEAQNCINSMDQLTDHFLKTVFK